MTSKAFFCVKITKGIRYRTLVFLLYELHKRISQIDFLRNADFRFLCNSLDYVYLSSGTKRNSLNSFKTKEHLGRIAQLHLINIETVLESKLALQFRNPDHQKIHAKIQRIQMWVLLSIKSNVDRISFWQIQFRA